MLENAVGSVPVLYRRRDVSFEDFSSYWRDVHGVFVAGFLGPSRYRMLHFAPYDPDLWDNDAVGRDLAEPRHLGGIAEFVFPNDISRFKWLNTVGTFADADDAIVFRRSTSYSVSQNGFLASKELDKQSDADETGTRVFAMFKAATPQEAFRGYMTDVLSPALAACSGVAHAQITLYDRYETPSREFLGGAEVERFLAPDEQHQATLEILFKDHLALGHFFGSHWPKLQHEFAAHVAQVHAYRVKGAYTLIRDGKLTLAGWLGGTRANLVRRVNAMNIIEALSAANAQRMSKAGMEQAVS